MVICQFQFVALFENHVILSEVWRSHTKSKNPFSFGGEYGSFDSVSLRSG